MCRVASILLTACLFAGVASAKVASSPAHRRSETLPVSTRSARARALFNQANTDFGNLHLAEALDGWRAAAKVDSRFAQAYVQIAFNSKDPAEQTRMLNRAKALAPRVTPSE